MSDLIFISLFLIPTILLLIPHLKSLSLFKSYFYFQMAMYIGIALGLASLFWVYFKYPLIENLIDIAGFGISVRVDSLSSLMYSLIAIIGLVVLRYSKNYLDGEKRHNRFVSDLAFTVLFVQLLVISDSLEVLFLSWVCTSIGLQKLLLFYPERKKAQMAARKKFFIARLSDTSLLISFIFMYQQFGSTDLSEILRQTQMLSLSSLPFLLEFAGIFLIVSACLKSVQIPFHGWLLDVMETPTPVSALLHAGLLNAGPFLIIRFATIIDFTSMGSTLLILIGGLSALFGAIIATTQPSIKTSLAYSSIGHMGFTLFVCGLGFYSAALLHLLAHSFYKAHSFLTSGTLIEKIQASGSYTYERSNHVFNLILSFFTSISLYFLVSYIWLNTLEVSFQFSIISGIIILGILSLHINTLDSNNSGRSIWYLILGSILVINCFYFFEHFFRSFLGNQIPGLKTLGIVDQVFAIVLIIVFFLTVLSQAVFSTYFSSPKMKKLEIHFRNGLYLNQLMNKYLRFLNHKPSTNS